MIDLNNYKATRQWNIDRGYAFKLVPELENDMLEEEKKEFFDAYELYKSIKDDCKDETQDNRVDLAVDMIDALCDYTFVAVGTDTKSQMSTLDVETQIKISAIKNNAEKMMQVIGTLLIDVIGAKVDLNRCYGFVVEANNLKPAKANADGKGTKGDKWIDPKHKIKEYLESLNIREYI